MGIARHRYVVDEAGRRVAVVIDLKTYRKMLADLEELESVRAFDAAKASGERGIPFEDAVREIEARRG